MPTYEYKCDTCEEVFEIFQSMTARRLTKCQDKSCKGRMKRLLGTGAGLIFKGSGFYETDYRSDSYKESAKKDSTAATESKKETKSSDTKKETKKTPAAAKSTSGAKKKKGD